MDRGAVEDYVARSESVFESSPQMDEANTKAAVLRDFLDLLDWKIPSNTRLEYPVEAFGQTYKVDYALILDGTPVAFLEAKGADTALTSSHEDQLSSYMTNKNVTYGVLTNGKQYRFFQRRVDAANVDVQKVGEMALEHLPDRMAVLDAYTTDAIESGESGRILDRINELRTARRHLKRNKDEIAGELVEVLSNNISESIASIAEPQTKELVDRIVEEINAEIDADDGAESGSVKREEEYGSESATDPADEGEEYTVRFHDSESASPVFSSDIQGDVLVESVNYLVSNYNLISKIEPLPYIPGRTRAILHESAEYDGKAMKLPKDLDGGYVLEANLSADQKKREIRRLADQCGITVSFGGDW
jgi:hypothetical protein